MDELTCPQCQGTMAPRSLGLVSVRRCEGCGALFLESSALGALIEAENDWHAHQSANTAALPRITAEMSEPPAAQPRSRAYVESLFRA
ncbi:zf-TFIIB domain-containing protein [Nocardioides pocheonensis]|nr:zf-TFIIB domain-containing protein [Nocardioides pocheonensis]